ncbi:hypothetical protein BC940DRAFT_312897 [Gongronella butleri]|nr:hypothetical protein BC940DRAFT_312897 [Gongronella butleri]
MNDHLGPPGGSPMRLVPQPMQLERSYDIKAKKDELRRLRAVRDQLRMESRDIMQEIDNSQLAVQSQLTAIGK